MPQATARICPKCKSAALDNRVKRGTLVKTVLFWLPLKRYHCTSCNKKSYVLVPGN